MNCLSRVALTAFIKPIQQINSKFPRIVLRWLQKPQPQILCTFGRLPHRLIQSPFKISQSVRLPGVSGFKIVRLIDFTLSNWGLPIMPHLVVFLDLSQNFVKFVKTKTPLFCCNPFQNRTHWRLKQCFYIFEFILGWLVCKVWFTVHHIS